MTMNKMFLALSVEMVDNKDLLRNFSLGLAIELLKEKYKYYYDIIDNFELLLCIDEKDREEVMMKLAEASTSLSDGTILPTNYKKYKDLVYIKRVALENNKPIYIFNEDKLTITREDDKLHGSEKTNNLNSNINNNCCSNSEGNKKIQSEAKANISTGTKQRIPETKLYKIVDGDANITYRETSEVKTITISHDGKTSKYII
jgi:hypothetical protein